jgi:hypothetical protein
MVGKPYNHFCGLTLCSPQENSGNKIPDCCIGIGELFSKSLMILMAGNRIGELPLAAQGNNRRIPCISKTRAIELLKLNIGLHCLYR